MRHEVNGHQEFLRQKRLNRGRKPVYGGVLSVLGKNTETFWISGEGGAVIYTLQTILPDRKNWFSVRGIAESDSRWKMIKRKDALALIAKYKQDK